MYDTGTGTDSSAISAGLTCAIAAMTRVRVRFGRESQRRIYRKIYTLIPIRYRCPERTSARLSGTGYSCFDRSLCAHHRTRARTHTLAVNVHVSQYPPV